jgi:hypothetical protein
MEKPFAAKGSAGRKPATRIANLNLYIYFVK